MNTNLLHEKINRFAALLKEGKLNIQIAKELVIDINTWMQAIDNAIGEYEFQQLIDADRIVKLGETIEYLKKAIVLSCHAEILTVASIMDKENFERAIDFLLNSKDRFNASNLYQIGKLLELSTDEGKDIKSLVELVNYARTGN